MKEQCFDEGTIQAFLDGELSSEMLETVARHLALCDDCANLLQEAEEESAFAFDILGEEFNTLVPTERIRANVYQAISALDKPKTSFWQKLFSFNFLSNPSIVAFASILVIVGISATVLSLRNNEFSKYQAAIKSNQIINNEIQLPTVNSTTIVKVPEKEVPDFTATKIVYRPEPKVVISNRVTRDRKPVVRETEVRALEGEDTFIKTIAALENTVNSKKDSVLKASSRVSYERDMAVIDDSIKRMRAEVQKNPKNAAAKQILRDSYQNKIELLNSVSERSELMARLD
jgi:hypothetical protein